QGRATQALRLALRLLPFWRQRGFLSEGRRWLEALLAQRDSTDTSPLFAAAYNGAGVLAMWQGDCEYARTCHETALAILHEQSERRDNAASVRAMTAMTHFRLGFLADRCGDCTAAQRHLERSLLLYGEIVDTAGEQMVRSRLGLVYSHGGDRKRAKAYLEESLAYFRAHNASGAAAANLLNLGLIALEQGRLRRAMALLEESLRLNEQVGDGFASAYCLTYLGCACLRSAEVVRAEEYFRRALRLVRADGNHEIPVRLLDGLAMVAALWGDFTHAACLWGSAAAVRSAKHITYGRAERRRYHHALACAQLSAEA